MNFEEKAEEIATKYFDFASPSGMALEADIENSLTEAYEQGLKVGRDESVELVEALEFYADKDTWTWARNPPKYEVAKSVFDGGERARAALANDRRKETT